MAGRFVTGFVKTAKGFKNMWHDHKALDMAGLGALAVPAAYHAYKGVKEKDKGEAASAGMDLAGLGLLARSVKKAHK